MRPRAVGHLEGVWKQLITAIGLAFLVLTPLLSQHAQAHAGSLRSTAQSTKVLVHADRAPQAVGALEAGFDDATAVLALPEPYRRRLRTPNSVERRNEEIRRRERVIRIFPNRQSALRLLGALLMEQHEQWTTGHCYLDMTAYWHWRQAHEPLQPTREVTIQTA